MFKPSAKYRCAQCRRRVQERDTHCKYCDWEVDLTAARETSVQFARMKRFYWIHKIKKNVINFGRKISGKPRI